MLSVIYAATYAESHYAECRYAECRYAECRCVECRGALLVSYLSSRHPTLMMILR